MLKSRVILLGGALIAAIGFPLTAQSQGTNQESEDRAAVRAAENRATEAFTSKQYDEALKQFSKLLVDTRQFKYYRPVARCHQMLGHTAEALRNFRLYLQNDRNISDDKRKETEGFIAELEQQQKSEMESAQAKDRKIEPLPPVPVDTRPVSPTPPPSSGESDGQTVGVAPVAVPERKTNSLGGAQVAGLIVGGVGIASVAVGAYFGVQAKDSANQINTKAVSGAVYDSTLQAIDDRGRSAETKLLIFAGIGGAALIGGGVLYFLGGQQSESTAATETRVPKQSVALLPMLSPRDLGASIRMTF